MGVVLVAELSKLSRLGRKSFREATRELPEPPGAVMPLSHLPHFRFWSRHVFSGLYLDDERSRKILFFVLLTISRREEGAMTSRKRLAGSFKLTEPRAQAESAGRWPQDSLTVRPRVATRRKPVGALQVFTLHTLACEVGESVWANM